MHFTDISGAQRISRTFTSFSQAAEEAGRSRIYGGIHFEFDNRAGLQSGAAVGRYIAEHYLQPMSASRNDRLAARTANRHPPSHGWVAISDGRNQADSYTTYVHPVSNSYSGSGASPASSYYLPVTNSADPTVGFAGDQVVASPALTVAPYCEPVVGENAADCELPKFAETCYFVSGW
jgi:hypothetical protein